MKVHFIIKVEKERAIGHKFLFSTCQCINLYIPQHMHTCAHIQREGEEGEGEGEERLDKDRQRE